MLDKASKTSLAKYDFRPDTTPSLSMFGSAKAGTDEALFVLTDHLCEVASTKVRSGDLKGAVKSLRKAFAMTQDHNSTELHGELLPAARMVSAAVRLELCGVLSLAGRHQRAAEEARKAAQTMTELWHAIGQASNLLAETKDLGDPAAGPPRPWKRLLLKPPAWITRCVEVTIQAKVRLATEMEVGLGPEDLQEALDVSSWLVSRSMAGGEAPDEDKEDTEVSAALRLPKESESVPETMVKLHLQALELAMKLLEEKSPVRVKTETAVMEAESRWQAAQRRAAQDFAADPLSITLSSADSGAGDAGRGPLAVSWSSVQFPSPSRGMMSQTGSSMESFCASLRPDQALKLLRQPAGLRLQPLDSPLLVVQNKMDRSQDSFTCSTMASSPTDSPKTGSRVASAANREGWLRPKRSTFSPASTGRQISTTDSESQTLPSLFSPDLASFSTKVHPGDVYYRSLPSSPQRSYSLPADQMARSDAAPKTAPSPEDQEPKHNPFEVWRKVLRGNHTLAGMQLKTYEGIRTLQDELINEKHQFSFWLADADNDELHDDRVYFSDAGVRSTRRIAKRKQLFRLKDTRPPISGSVKKEKSLSNLDESLRDASRASRHHLGTFGLKSLGKLMQESASRMDKTLRLGTS